MAYTRQFILIKFIMLFLASFLIFSRPAFADDNSFKVSINFVDSGGISGNADSVTAGGYDVKVSHSGDLKTDTKAVFDGILTILSGAGAVILTFGIGKMILSFRDDNAGGKAEAMNILVAGALVLSVSGILNGLMA